MVSDGIFFGLSLINLPLKFCEKYEYCLFLTGIHLLLQTFIYIFFEKLRLHEIHYFELIYHIQLWILDLDRCFLIEYS